MKYHSCPRCFAVAEPDDKRCIHCGLDMLGISVPDTLEHKEAALFANHKLLWNIAFPVLFMTVTQLFFQDYFASRRELQFAGLMLASGMGSLIATLVLKRARSRGFR